MHTPRYGVCFLVVGIACVGPLAVVGAARAVCGDGVVDAGEQCDHGAQNGQDACCSASCEVVDTDFDGTCDALDPCQDGQGTRLKESTLAIARLSTAPGDDTLRLSGRVTVPGTPAVDPSVSGIRLRMFAPAGDPRGSAILDATLPGGARWKVRPTGAGWTYRDAKGHIAGIRRVDVKLLAPLVPTTRLTTVAFTFTGRRGSYAVTPDMVTSEGSFLQVAVALGASAAAAGAQCGESWYSSVNATHCGFSASGDRVTCTGPPPVGPCHVGDPDDLELCDLLDAAHAEDALFTATGSYLSGDCTALPGFVASPGVTCSAVATGGHFVVTTSNPLALRLSCVWDSSPAPDGQNLTCS